MLIRAAVETDVPAIVSVLRANRSDRSLFQRSMGDIRRHVGEFLVGVTVTGEVVGCACLHLTRNGLGDISTVAVHPRYQGRGIGRRLVEESLIQAERRSFARLWLGTAKPGYFREFGFEPMSRWNLPILVLVEKLPPVFRQRITRWPAVLLGKLTYMQRPVLRHHRASPTDESSPTD